MKNSFVLVSILVLLLLAQHAIASEKISNIKIKCGNNSSLANCLTQFKQATGFTVVCASCPKEKTLSQDVFYGSTTSIISNIMDKIGIHDYSIVVNNQLNTITVNTLFGQKPDSIRNEGIKESSPFPVGSDTPTATTGIDTFQYSDPRDRVILPPSNPGEKGLTLREVDDIQAKEELNQENAPVEIFPPSMDGEKTLTLDQINAINKDEQTKKKDDMDIEVFPPSEGEERGMTLREFNGQVDEKKENKKPINPLDIEVIPPSQSGERGMTLREFNNSINNGQ